MAEDPKSSNAKAGESRIASPDVDLLNILPPSRPPVDPPHTTSPEHSTPQPVESSGQPVPSAIAEPSSSPQSQQPTESRNVDASQTSQRPVESVQEMAGDLDSDPALLPNGQKNNHHVEEIDMEEQRPDVEDEEPEDEIMLDEDDNDPGYITPDEYMINATQLAGTRAADDNALAAVGLKRRKPATDDDEFDMTIFDDTHLDIETASTAADRASAAASLAHTDWKTIGGITINRMTGSIAKVAEATGLPEPSLMAILRDPELVGYARDYLSSTVRFFPTETNKEQVVRFRGKGIATICEPLLDTRKRAQWAQPAPKDKLEVWKQEDFMREFTVKVHTVLFERGAAPFLTLALRDPKAIWALSWIMAKHVLKTCTPTGQTALQDTMNAHTTKLRKVAHQQKILKSVLGTKAPLSSQYIKDVAAKHLGPASSRRKVPRLGNARGTAANPTEAADDDTVRKKQMRWVKNLSQGREGDDDGPDPGDKNGAHVHPNLPDLTAANDAEAVTTYIREDAKDAAEKLKHPAVARRQEMMDYNYDQLRESLMTEARKNDRRLHQRLASVVHRALCECFNDFEFETGGLEFELVKQSIADRFDNAKIQVLSNPRQDKDGVQPATVLGVSGAESVQLAAKDHKEVKGTPLLNDFDAPTKEELAEIRKWAQQQNDEAFQPTYLKDALIEAQIPMVGPRHNRVIPGTTKSLRWWQIVATKWATDLLDLSPDGKGRAILGGIIADLIGLGKSIEAGAIAAKIINAQYDFACLQLESLAAAAAAAASSTAQATPHTVPSVPQQDTAEASAATPVLQAPPQIGSRANSVAPPPSTSSTKTPDCPQSANVHSRNKPSLLEPALHRYWPSIYVTMATLTAQVAIELQGYLGAEYRVVRVSSDKSTDDRYYHRNGLDRRDEFFKESDPNNLKVIFVVSYNWVSRNFGPEFVNKSTNGAFNSCAAGEIPTERVNFSYHFMRSRTNIMFLDECQDQLRNVRSAFQSIQWFDAQIMFPLSGYPSPRGPKDFAAYLRLLCRPELHERAHTPDPSIHWNPETDNPFAIKDDDDPRSIFQLDYELFSRWIVENRDLDETQQALAARKALAKFVLRRDYSSSIPLGHPDRSIGQNLPPLVHRTVHRAFCPSALVQYKYYSRMWEKRMITTYTTKKGDMKTTPNGRAIRALEILAFCPVLGSLHKLADAKRRPKGHVMTGRPNDDNPYNVDRDSFFYEHSAIALSLPPARDDGKAGMWRYLFQLCATHKAIYFPEDMDWHTMGAIDLATQIQKWAPKVQALFTMVADNCLLRDEKLISWFSTPLIHDLCMEALSLMRVQFYSLTSASTLGQRQLIQDQWNDHNDPGRLLLASARVGGTGYNYQTASRLAVVIDGIDSENREAQIQGRQYRLGAQLQVEFFVVVMEGTTNTRRIEDNLTAALGAVSTFFSNSATGDIHPRVPHPVFEKFGHKYLESFVSSLDESSNTLHYHNVLSPSGWDLVLDTRTKSNDPAWLPTEFAPASAVLTYLMSKHKSSHVNHAFGAPVDKNDLVPEYHALVEKELEAREQVRKLKAPDGLDPLAPPQTPKKAKKKVGGSTSEHVTPGGNAKRTDADLALRNPIKPLKLVNRPRAPTHSPPVRSTSELYETTPKNGNTKRGTPPPSSSPIQPSGDGSPTTARRSRLTPANSPSSPAKSQPTEQRNQKTRTADGETRTPPVASPRDVPMASIEGQPETTQLPTTDPRLKDGFQSRSPSDVTITEEPTDPRQAPIVVGLPSDANVWVPTLLEFYCLTTPGKRSVIESIQVYKPGYTCPSWPSGHTEPPAKTRINTIRPSKLNPSTLRKNTQKKNERKNERKNKANSSLSNSKVNSDDEEEGAVDGAKNGTATAHTAADLDVQ